MKKAVSVLLSVLLFCASWSLYAQAIETKENPFPDGVRNALWVESSGRTDWGGHTTYSGMPDPFTLLVVLEPTVVGLRDDFFIRWQNGEKTGVFSKEDVVFIASAPEQDGNPVLLLRVQGENTNVILNSGITIGGLAVRDGAADFNEIRFQRRIETCWPCDLVTAGDRDDLFEMQDGTILFGTQNKLWWSESCGVVSAQGIEIVRDGENSYSFSGTGSGAVTLTFCRALQFSWNVSVLPKRALKQAITQNFFSHYLPARFQDGNAIVWAAHAQLVESTAMKIVLYPFAFVAAPALGVMNALYYFTAYLIELFYIR